MTEHEHTPGPWIITEGKKWEWHISGKGWRSFATFYINYVFADEGAANVRLIAAAPDLLEALEELAERCESCNDKKEHHEGRCWLCMRCMEFKPRAKARAAIAKAKGESNG